MRLSIVKIAGGMIIAYALGVATGACIRPSFTEFSNQHAEIVAETNTTIQVQYTNTTESTRVDSSLDWFKADGKFIWDGWRIK